MATYDLRQAHGGGGVALIRWGAVVAGALIGLSLMLLLATLWAAIGFASGAQDVAGNIQWFLLGSAVLSMFVGGLLAGWLSGVPGAAPGFFNGMTVWAMLLVGALAIGIPGLLQAVGFDLAAVTPEQATGELAVQGDALWAGFLSLVIGLLAAALGGAIGGAMTRPAWAHAQRSDMAHAQRSDMAHAQRSDMAHAQRSDWPQGPATGPMAAPPGADDRGFTTPRGEGTGRQIPPPPPSGPLGGEHLGGEDRTIELGGEPAYAQPRPQHPGEPRTEPGDGTPIRR